MKNSPKERLKKHRKGLESHFKRASDFLVKCQIREPFVTKGVLRGCVCPWEIGTADREGFTILEDFHDTLEAIWVWSYYAAVTGRNAYKPNIESGWEYVIANWERFIPKGQEGEGLYDCSHVALSGALYQKVFLDKSYSKWSEQAGNRMAFHISRTKSVKAREYSDTWWMTACLASAARSLKRSDWMEIAMKFVEHNLINKVKPFSEVEIEPHHRGPGGHDFFSLNANKVIALLSCYTSEVNAKEMLLKEFLPRSPRRFIDRHADENPWNANAAAALGKCYHRTGDEEFLHRYFAIMDILKARDPENLAALPRSKKFVVRESWVTFFYAYAYASIINE